MAAIRTRRVRLTTSKRAIRGEIAQKTAKRRLKRTIGRPRMHHDEKIYYEVVATSAEEANGGLFTQVGDVFVLKPAEHEAFLWNRVVLMSEPEHREVWEAPSVGVRAALKALGVHIPASIYGNPSAWVAWSTISKEGNVVYPNQELLRNKWLPHFVYRGSKFGAEGLFASKTAAYQTAGLFGITVYKTAKASDWYRTSLPDVQSDVLRSNQYDEDAYQHWKQTLLSTAEVRAEAGFAPDMDWNAIQRAISEIFGPRTMEVMQRLRADLAPELHRLSHLASRHPGEYTENRPAKRRRSIPAWP